jgi:hypothetical protein
VFVQPVPAYDVCSDDGACIHEYMADQARALYHPGSDDLRLGWNWGDGSAPH